VTRRQNRSELRLTEPQKRVLLQLRIAGEMPRVRLAQALGMSDATMTRLVQHLIALDVVEERDGTAVGQRGRPIVPLGISGRGGWSVGATVHPGWLEIALVDFRGRPLVQDSQPFDSADPAVFARTLDRRLRALAADHGFMRGKFLGLGIAVPGYALGGDPDRRAVVSWLSGWNDIGLRDLFADMLGMPVWIENDATVAALAEYYQPAIMARHRSALVLFLGHGIGGGLIAARDLLVGEHGNAGEVGRLFPTDRPRPSGIDLIHTLRAAGVAIDSLSGLDALLEPQAGLIARWVERVAGQLHQAIASGVAWLDPGAIIISGALPVPILRALTDHLDPLFAARTDNYQGTIPAIYASPLGSASVVIGAAMVPIHAVTMPDA
jgi:predicted NBD/HSP70 family sugar kinase